MERTASRTRVSTVDDLVRKHLIPEQDRGAVEAVAERYAVSVSTAMLEAISDDDGGVVAAQFVPTTNELRTHPDEIADPIGDEMHSPVRGVVHRYPDRALLLPLLVCPVYCRFCFRREVVGGDDKLLPLEELETALAYIEEHPSIWEVILTGGDPGILPVSRLRHIIERLDRIAHIESIRLHTRVPIVEPRRITDEFCDALRRDTAVWVAIHANAAAEFTPAAVEALSRLSDSGIPLLSQTVLLRGVNDSVAALDALFRSFVKYKVKPYYLHQLDLAPGTQHFRVPISEGRKLIRKLRGNLSGIAMPTYVLDLPGGLGKTPLDSAWIEMSVDGEWAGLTPLGHPVHYVEPQ